ncbi:protein TALPID3-like [Stegastes partitus]|uniref:Protein TALPID3-like n=1 Tax=Stegastes partitus TaxID=144197 RepID=A0A9Y4MUA9_9TELE|nr:PREDICTED: protein TALPID3-like [Stegastes partitus]XP_008275322.1 PREDICTED: protein TALPID3-like [Stegastes partitus]
MTEEEAVCSFSSSLQEMQDMDLDPPSEGQLRGHDLLLALLNKMEEGVTSRGERPQPEGSDQEEGEEEVSVGEVRDERTTKPHRTTSPRRQSPTSSPGQISQAADVGFEATNRGSVAVGDQAAEPMGTLTSELSLSHLDDSDAAAQVVRQLDTPTAGRDEDDGTRRTKEVRLPSVRPEDTMDESMSAAAESDSSSDVF